MCWLSIASEQIPARHRLSQLSRVLARDGGGRGYLQPVGTLALSLANNGRVRIPVSQEWKEQEGRTPQDPTHRGSLCGAP